MNTSRRGAIQRILWLCFLVLAAACSRSSAEEAAVLEVVRRNLEAAQNEDLATYMATLDESSPSWSATQTLMEGIFREFDLEYELLETEVLSIEADIARVRIVQITRKAGGDRPFQNNRLTAVHVLHRSDSGEWRIFNTEVESLERLER